MRALEKSGKGLFRVAFEFRASEDRASEVRSFEVCIPEDGPFDVLVLHTGMGLCRVLWHP